MPNSTAQERKQAYTAMAKTLAKLHSVDFTSVELQGFGRHSGYCSRQVDLTHSGLPACVHPQHWLAYSMNMQIDCNPHVVQLLGHSVLV